MTSNFLHRHPLEGLLPDVSPIRAVDHLEVVRGTAIALVLATAGEAVAVTAGLAAGDDLSVRFVSPGEWLVVAPAMTPEGLQRDLAVLLGDGAHVSDQSDGRVLLRLSGPNVRRILAKGVGVDLHPSGFSVGSAANVLCGHISLNLARVQDNEFDLIVMRSYAAFLLEDLRTMGREFDLSTGFSA